MKRNYTHLSAEERALIMAEQSRGSSGAQIAVVLGRAPSTVYRELRRNNRTGTVYNATVAAKAYRTRRLKCVQPRKLLPGSKRYGFVHDKLLYRCWSPQQISATLRTMHPDDESWQVSHETIYAAIYAHPRGALKKGLVAALRQAKPKRGGRRKTAALGGMVIPEHLRIKHRPEDITTRLLPGHWEGDFIKGALNRSAIGTLVERKSRFVVLCKMTGCGADAALEGFTRQMKKLPTFLRQSLTYDRGSEMARHAELAKRLRMDIWFADPYAPWQRGSNENTNGLLRQFLPKGTDLSAVSQVRLNEIAQLLNSRPRKTLDWRTPEDVMADDIQNFGNSVALDS
jgi:IS30 family transposase